METARLKFVLVPMTSPRSRQHDSLIRVVYGSQLQKDPSEEGSKSGGPGSNRQPLAWKAKALPLSYRREQVQLYKNSPIFKGVH